MKRFIQLVLVMTVVGVGALAYGCDCGATTAYYAPSTTASVVTGSPMPTTVGYATTTAYYAPTVSYYEPTTTYYAPATTAYYAPTTAYYEPSVSYYAPATTAYYAPTTAYYAPTTAFYSPTYARPVYYSPYYGYRVPGQPIRNLFR